MKAGGDEPILPSFLPEGRFLRAGQMNPELRWPSGL